MISPTYRNRIKRELVDRVRHLIAIKANTITSHRPGLPTIVYRIFSVGPVEIRSESDGYTKISWAARPGKRMSRLRVFNFAGKGYRFGRNQANFELIMEVLDILRKEMVLDDLADV